MFPLENHRGGGEKGGWWWLWRRGLGEVEGRRGEETQAAPNKTQVAPSCSFSGHGIGLTMYSWRTVFLADTPVSIEMAADGGSEYGRFIEIAVYNPTHLFSL